MKAAIRKLHGVFVGFSLQTKMFCFIVPVLLLFLGATFMIYDQTRQTLKEAVLTGSEHNFSLIATEWNTKMQDIHNNSNRLASDKVVKAYINGDMDAMDMIELQNSISNQLFNLIILSECLQSAFLVRGVDDFIAQTPFLYDSGDALIEALYGTQFTYERFVSYQTARGTYFCYVKTLSAPDEGTSACLVLVLKPDYARTLVRKYGGSNIEYYISDVSGNMFYSTPGARGADIDLADVLAQRERIIETQRHVIVRSELYGNLLQLVAAVSKATLFRDLDGLQRSYIFTMAAAFVLIMLVMFRIFRSFSRRIKSLNDTMATVALGNYTARCEPMHSDEAGQLAKSLNSMLDNLQNLVIDVSLKEIELKRAQLDAIKSQNSPHFLYNTLETIRMISLRNGDKAVPNIIKQLSKMLRYSTENREWVTVAQEVEQIVRYLDIQKLRFKDKFTATVDIDPNILDCEIPRLLLQPLVENAFKHGIEPKDGTAELMMFGRWQDGALSFEISDTGVGMEPAVLAGIQGYIDGWGEPGAAMGIGFKNVIDRLRLHFPESGGMQLDSEYGRGTSVRLAVPAIGGGDAGVEGDTGR